MVLSPLWAAVHEADIFRVIEDDLSSLIAFVYLPWAGRLGSDSFDRLGAHVRLPLMPSLMALTLQHWCLMSILTSEDQSSCLEFSKDSIRAGSMDAVDLLAADTEQTHIKMNADAYLKV
jgi:hypothetical protein